MKNTFVLNLDEDVAAFLDQKTRGSGDANAFISELLRREQRQGRSGHRESIERETDALMENTPDATH